MESDHRKIVFILGLSFVFSGVLQLYNPNIEYTDRGVFSSVQNGDCRELTNGSICFNTISFLGFNSGISPVVKLLGDYNMDENPLIYVFERESDLLHNQKAWGNEKLGQNFTGKVPNFNVSSIDLE